MTIKTTCISLRKINNGTHIFSNNSFQFRSMKIIQIMVITREIIIQLTKYILRVGEYTGCHVA